jgi:hypothetical protein
VLEGLTVADPASLAPVPADGATMGEIFMRGNIVMKGYLKNPRATEEAFAGGWFHSGDLGVMHPDGYIELKDRSKDIIISGGENISAIEVEDVLYRHPAVFEAAVVARPDQMWGETPCVFVTLKPEAEASAEDIITFCRTHLTHFKAAADGDLWPPAENFDRQDPEIQAARARQTRLTRFAKKGGVQPPQSAEQTALKCLPQKFPPSVIGSNGPLSNPTPAVQPDRGERVFIPLSRHSRRARRRLSWVGSEDHRRRAWTYSPLAPSLGEPVRPMASSNLLD